MSFSLNRLFKPTSLAVIGGAWANNVVEQCERLGFAGQIWPVNPKRETMGRYRCYRSIAELPGSPDAVFLAVNRHQAIDTIAQLASMDAGGVICFASGFKETGDDEGERLQQRLVEAAGHMPVLGPNCYGIINGLDRTAIWPDVHGIEPVSRGVALISQSSNIAINLTMQQRGLPVAYTMAAGNGAMISLSDLIRFSADQKEVSAIGLYVEGFGDALGFHQACAYAKSKGKPVVALKAGASGSARALTMSHTASLAGGHDVAAAFLEKRCSVGRVESIEGLLEALKLLHFCGPLPSEQIVTMSSSGGEACLLADAAENSGVRFAAFDEAVVASIYEHCHPLVQVSNPFDYHTFDWGKKEALNAMYSAVMRAPQALTALVLDWPKEGTGNDEGWMVAVNAWVESQKATGARAVVLSSITENMPEKVRKRLIAENLAPMQGFGPFIEAVRAAGMVNRDMGLAPLATPEQAVPEQVVREQATPEQVVREQATPEQAAPEQAVPEQAAREQVVSEQAVPEQAVPEQAVSEQTTPEQAVREQAVREQVIPQQAAREQVAPEQAVREQAAPEQAVREQAAPEQAVREQAVSEQAVPEQAAPEQATPEQAVREQAVREQVIPQQAVRGHLYLWDEYQSKQAIPGLSVPEGFVTDQRDIAIDFGRKHKGAIVLKACGNIAHKSELNAVLIQPDDVGSAFDKLISITGQVLVETMAAPAVVEALVGVHLDPVVGLCLTVGMGGTLTEVWQDSVTLPLPVHRDELYGAIENLKLNTLLKGFRGNQTGDTEALFDTVMAVNDFAVTYADTLIELDINPVMVHANGYGVTAVDAVIRTRAGKGDIK